ncbi:MAG: hypothetical protein HZA63_02875 [Rhodocyclales bacterium]|nr:hypothetical protein [Rhodocyclales bacterium]
MEFKKPGSTTYLVAAIFSVLIACGYAVQLTPVFLRLFVPFPALEEATVLTGTVEVVGEWSFKRPAAYFIVNADGRHRVYCGLPTERLSCFGFFTPSHGATGTVWFHPTFGVLQWDLILHTVRAEGYREQGIYSVEKDLFEKQFDYKRYNIKYFVVFVALLIALYQFIKYRSLLAVERSKLNSSSHRRSNPSVNTDAAR